MKPIYVIFGGILNLGYVYQYLQFRKSRFFADMHNISIINENWVFRQDIPISISVINLQFTVIKVQASNLYIFFIKETIG